MAYSDGVVTIASVTGDVVITATATGSTSSYTNQLPLATDVDGSIFNGTGFQEGYPISASSGSVSANTATDSLQGGRYAVFRQYDLPCCHGQRGCAFLCGG